MKDIAELIVAITLLTIYLVIDIILNISWLSNLYLGLLFVAAVKQIVNFWRDFI